jgi:hemerythrin
MALFAWNDAYAVGVPEIDRQHQQLFAYAGQLHSAMIAGNGREVLGPILAGLITYTRAHFATEERLMQQSRFAGYAEHKAEHDALTRRVLRLQQEFDAGRVALTVEVMNFVRDWLARHITGTDQQLGDHLQRAA